MAPLGLRMLSLRDNEIVDGEANSKQASDSVVVLVGSCTKRYVSEEGQEEGNMTAGNQYVES